MVVRIASVGEPLFRDKSIDIPLSQGNLQAIFLLQKFLLGTRRGRQFLKRIAYASYSSAWKMWDSGWSEGRVNLPRVLGGDGPSVLLALLRTESVGHVDVSQVLRGDPVAVTERKVVGWYW